MAWVELGRIGAPFGVKGWTHVESYTDPPERLLSYERWVLQRAGSDPRAWKLSEGRVHGDRLVARLESVSDRDAAAALTGAVIQVDREDLPPTGEREYYRADLIGFEVRNLEGALLGSVAYFVDAPAGPVMVVRDLSVREHWVLATARHLRAVRLDQRLIQVDWPIEPE